METNLGKSLAAFLRRPVAVAAMGWALLACGAPLSGQDTAGPARGAIPADSVGLIKLRDESIDQVLDLLERWTGKTVLRPQALPANTYTLTLEETIGRDEAILALETLLNMNGVAVTPLGRRFLKITPLTQARAEAPEFIEGSALGLPPSGRIASKLFRLEFLRVAEFLPQIAAILNPNLGAPPVLFEKNNSALLTDSVSNLQRIERLLAELDRPTIGAHEPKIYALQSARASDVVTKLRTLITGPLQTELGAATSYQGDDRTNRIILVSDPRQHVFFDRLIATLDGKADPNIRNEVIFLKNAAAKEIATLLSELVAGRNEAAREAGQASPPASTPAAGPGPAPPPAPSPRSALADLAAGAAQEFSALLTILPEERTNALVVSGTPDDIRLLRELVTQIDVLLAQVRIEVVIAEVTLGDEATSGINALGLAIENSKIVGFSADAPGITIEDGLVFDSYDLSARISLMTTPRKTNTQILSVPTIITTHNKEAEIFVGEQRPVISSFLTDVTSDTPGTAGGAFGRTTLTAKDIGIELKVKPLIGNDGSVQMEISQEVNDILGEIIIDGNPQPRIGRRSTKSFVSARTGEIIVLGGLQRNTRNRTSSRLGPVPFLGDLFGTRKREAIRTDLVFFLRPYVLTNTPADNTEALRRIDATPQRHEVRSALDPQYQPSGDSPKRN